MSKELNAQERLEQKTLCLSAAADEELENVVSQLIDENCEVDFAYKIVIAQEFARYADNIARDPNACGLCEEELDALLAMDGEITAALHEEGTNKLAPGSDVKNITEALTKVFENSFERPNVFDQAVMEQMLSDVAQVELERQQSTKGKERKTMDVER